MYVIVKIQINEEYISRQKINYVKEKRRRIVGRNRSRKQ